MAHVVVRDCLHIQQIASYLNRDYDQLAYFSDSLVLLSGTYLYHATHCVVDYMPRVYAMGLL